MANIPLYLFLINHHLLDILDMLIHILFSLIARSYATPLTTMVVAEPTEPEEEPGSAAFWGKLGLSAVLVLAGGVFAGYALIVPKSPPPF